jgi:hypothetical protein
MLRHLLIETSFVTRRTPSIASTLLALDRQKQSPMQVRAVCVVGLPEPYLPLEEFDRAFSSCSHDMQQSRSPIHACLRETLALHDRYCRHEHRNIGSDDYREQKSLVVTLQFDGDTAL